MSELKKEWYVVNTYAGQENRVKENLERRVKNYGSWRFFVPDRRCWRKRNWI